MAELDAALAEREEEELFLLVFPGDVWEVFLLVDLEAFLPAFAAELEDFLDAFFEVFFDAAFAFFLVAMVHRWTEDPGFQSFICATPQCRAQPVESRRVFVARRIPVQVFDPRSDLHAFAAGRGLAQRCAIARDSGRR